MKQEIKAVLPENPWDALKTTINSLVSELVVKSISHFEVLFEIKDGSPLRSIKIIRKSDETIEVTVRTSSTSQPLLPSEFYLGALGWELVNEGQVRWRRTFAKDAVPFAVTMHTMLVTNPAYQLKERIWFSIEADKRDVVEKHTKNLWHYEKNRKLLCLPGQNMSMALEAA
jgi:hypothetical protein